MTKLTLYIFLFLLTQSWSLHSYAKGTYLEPEKFLSDVFNNNPNLFCQIQHEKVWETSMFDFKIGWLLCGNKFQMDEK